MWQKYKEIYGNNGVYHLLKWPHEKYVRLHLERQQVIRSLSKQWGEKNNYFQISTCLPRLLPHVFSQPCQSGFNLKPLCVPSLLLSSPPSSSSPSPSPPFQKLEDWFEALSLNQELGIPLPAELDELHQRLSSLHWPKDGSPSQSTDQSSTPTAASPDSSSMTDNGT